MKKTIAALALTASSTSAMALMAPADATKVICLATFEDANGVLRAGTCDMARNNEILGTQLLDNGCAEGQISLISQERGGQFDINIRNCLPPNVVQL